MIRRRYHFRRLIHGTASREYLQVMYSPADDQTGDVQVDRWTRTGGSTAHRVSHLPGKLENMMTEANDEKWDQVRNGWELCYEETLDDQADLGAQMVLVKIHAQEDLLPDIEALASALHEVDLMLEREGSFLAGRHQIDMTRKRRRSGETRELRYDTIAATVPWDSMAAKMLSFLAIKHAGKIMDMQSEPVDLTSFLSSIEDDPKFATLFEHFGVELHKTIRPGVLLRPWGKQIQPAVF